MKNEAKARTMNPEDNQGLTPKLRFPEFRDSPEWDERPFGDLYTFESTNTFSRDKLNYETGSVKNIHYGDIHTRFQPLFDIRKELVPFVNATESLDRFGSASYCTEGDVVFADASEDLADVGKSIELVALRGDRVLSGTHTLLARPKGTLLIVGFGGHLFLSERIRKQIRKEAQGSKVFGISAARLSNVKVCFPVDKAEQQKIADCLSSLDELIAGDSRKLDALKAHKKGLMQQLFPREGETLPYLRFPEFRDAPEWEVKPLEQVATYENGKAHENHISEDGRYIVVNSRFISTEGEVRKYSNDAFCMADSGDILMVLSDVPNGKALAKCFFVEADNLYAVNQRICKIKPVGIDGNLLFKILDRNPFFLAFDDGVKQTNLRKEDVLNCPICFPQIPDEQKKVGDSVSSLDELISAQSFMLDALKIYKKGLMQHLFPSAHEVEA
jgi:type I restriction enzyme, S subunit